MLNSDATDFWCLKSSGGVVVRQWSEEFEAVVYSVPTGDTHKVSILAVEVLKFLQHAPASFFDLSVFLKELVEPTDQGSLERFLRDTLRQLKDSGLIVDASP